MTNKNDFTICDFWVDSPQRPLRLLFEVDGDYTAFKLEQNNDDVLYMYYGIEKNENEWAVYVEAEVWDENGEPITEYLDVDDELKRVLCEKADEYIRDTKNMTLDECYVKYERETLADLIYLADLMM